MNFLRRLSYAVALLVFGLPALPFWICGIYINQDGDWGGDHGFFFDAGIGFLFIGFILATPFIALASGLKWIATGRGIEL